MSEFELYQCFNKHQKDFLVSVTVHKARNLNTLNADTFVSIYFNNETRRTKTYRNSDCPFFNEYFVFEVKTTLENLLKKNIRLMVIQLSSIFKKSSIVGELNINLSSIWTQNYHTFIKKWGVLEKIGDDQKNITAGYLQIDLTIISNGELPTPAALTTYNDDIIEENLLLPAASKSNPVNVKYLVNIFDGNFIVKRDYIIQVSFGSFHTRTRQSKYSKYCVWNEQMIFYGKFQSLNQLIILDLLVQDYYQWRVKCTVELNFNDMSWKVGDKYTKPAFGPSHVTFYEGEHKNSYYGKLLISIETHDIDEKMTVSSLNNKEDIIMPVNESEFWNDEIFKVNMIILNVESFTASYSNIRAQLCCEEITSNPIDIDLKDYGHKRIKLRFSEFNSNDRPLLSMSIKLPDNRLKNQAINLLRMLLREMESHIRNFKLFEARYYDSIEYQMRCLKMLHNDLKSMLDGLKNKIYCKTFKQFTEWDQNYVKFLQSTLDICITKISRTLDNPTNKESVKSSFEAYISIRDIISTSIINIHGSPSEIFLNITKDNKLLGFHRFSMLDYFHSQAFDSKGEFSGKLQSITVKPSTCLHSCETCGCMLGKFDIIMWIGSDKELNEWLPQNAIEMSSNKINFTIEKYYKCNVYVHQAKIQPGICKDDLCDPKLMVMANGTYERTKVINQSISIIWNEVLVLENVKTFEIGDGMYHDCPSIVAYLYDEDKKKADVIGIAHIKLPIKSNDPHPEDRLLKAIPDALIPEKISIRKIYHQLINQFPPQLRWISFFKNGKVCAEVLMSAELIPLYAPTITIMERDKNEPIPEIISPNIRKFHIEVTFAGIRNASRISSFTSARYKIQLSMGELALMSSFSLKGYKKNLNFIDPYASGYLLLPEEFQFWPPIIIQHVDLSHKNVTTVGAAMIRRPEQFFVEDKPKELQRFLIPMTSSKATVHGSDVEIEVDEKLPLLGSSKIQGSFLHIKRMLIYFKIPKFLLLPIHGKQVKTILIENQYTWWTKFYNSYRDPSLHNECLHELKVYKSELEKQVDFEYFNDWATPIDLYRAKEDACSKSIASEKYATLKCSIKISKCSGKEFFQTENVNLVPSTFRFKRLSNLAVEIPIVVRVYIVKAVNLRSHDAQSHSDAFIKIEYGGQALSDRAHYVPNQFSPIFGKRYQLNGVIPKYTQLKISIYDRDTLSNDDLIGKTKIDIENRLRSKYRAFCGLQKEYDSKGYNAWRNSELPSVILEEVCIEKDLALPEYFPDRVLIAEMEFTDSGKISKDENAKEKLALTVLNNFDKIPAIGHKFVPEHVETRSLYRKDRPGIEQGKILMWIEIFDPKKSIPEPVDITPIPPRRYELRVIIWNTKDVVLNEQNIFGKNMSDIYLKGWMENINNAQFTDIHYRSLTGEGNFNWRMIFPFKYSIGEDMMIIVKKKKPFEKFDTEIKLPPVLNLQIWDNDTFSPDDFLGAASINLSHFPEFSLTAEKCTGKKSSKYENLFAIDGSIRGWCPVYGRIRDNESGKVDIELEVLTEEEAKVNPAGTGREGPKKLPSPNRPDTSFIWYENPGLSFKHIVLPQTRKLACIICSVVIVLIILLFGLAFIFGIPQKLLGFL
ncbi:otoferlin [Chironomus tepperi]|uniref:otoferlin n=1 Tax=Chironomus tepperi TaxID=113505 RepID=UPI00391F3B60